MEKLGTALNITREGSLLVGGCVCPKEGKRVMTSDKMLVGHVKRVFGPVSSPYVVVELVLPPKERNSLVGRDVYF